MNDNLATIVSDGDRLALERFFACRPSWTGMARAGDVVDLPERTILHAGPPFDDPETICTPIANSVAAAAMFEGWAGSLDEARTMVRSGAIRIEPAQDRNCVVPLASALSPSMAVHVVTDPARPGIACHAPVNGGNGPALRLGLSDPAVVEHLRWLNGPFADALAASTILPVDLIAVADRALVDGDDCHGRTIAATNALRQRLFPDSDDDGSATFQRFMANGPGFFLNLWMASVKCMLSAADGVMESSFVTAAGSNGVTTGIKLAGGNGAWITAPATVPVGDCPDGISPADALPAIGDSAIVDVAGMGAMAMHLAPAQLEAMGHLMPESSDRIGRRIFAGTHPGFTNSGLRSGLLAAVVAQQERAPSISLGVLDRHGSRGRIYGGIFTPPVSLFRRAAAEIPTTRVSP
ncbi:MAG: DUF1116 domain-containing protein [Rhodospirillales bacterium]